MAARIRDRLAATLGDANVFMDVDNLRPGQRFDKELEKALAETDVFLAVVGTRWQELLAKRQASGERDYVREEIAGALRRGILVIPLLIERAPLPRHDTLPGDMRDLVLHQKHVISHERFGRDVAELVEVIQSARTEDRGQAEAYRTSGGSHYARRDYDRAIADFSKVIEIDPKDVLAYVGRGQAHHEKRHYDRAIADYSKAIEIDPKDADAYYNRGRTYEDQRRRPEAIKDFQQALRLAPDDLDSRNALKRLGA